MIKYFVDPNTQMIHRVADFPTPKRKGFTHCGRDVKKLIRCREDMSRVAPYRMCLKCIQLTGATR